jgi:hypothetical protein
VCKCVLPLGDNPVAVNKYIRWENNIRKDTEKIVLIVVEWIKLAQDRDN